jgi:hypothetical protein
MLNAAGAAGISQPWRAQRHCSWRTHAFAGIRACQLERLAPVSRGTGKECAVRNVSSAQKRVTVANANSTTAGLRPPLLRMCVSASQKTLFFRQTNAVPCTRSGGRKPPVQYLPHANSKRANSPHCRCRRSLQPTAGLRPPLLRMCVSASRMALYAANTRRATKSGWREPAVGSITSLQLENARFCQHPCAPTRAAGARSAVVREKDVRCET